MIKGQRREFPDRLQTPYQWRYPARAAVNKQDKTLNFEPS